MNDHIGTEASKQRRIQNPFELFDATIAPPTVNATTTASNEEQISKSAATEVSKTTNRTQVVSTQHQRSNPFSGALPPLQTLAARPMPVETTSDQTREFKSNRNPSEYSEEVHGDFYGDQQSDATLSVTNSFVALSIPHLGVNGPVANKEGFNDGYAAIGHTSNQSSVPSSSSKIEPNHNRHGPLTRPSQDENLSTASTPQSSPPRSAGDVSKPRRVNPFVVPPPSFGPTKVGSVFQVSSHAHSDSKSLAQPKPNSESDIRTAQGVLLTPSAESTAVQRYLQQQHTQKQSSTQIMDGGDAALSQYIEQTHKSDSEVPKSIDPPLFSERQEHPAEYAFDDDSDDNVDVDVDPAEAASRPSKGFGLDRRVVQPWPEYDGVQAEDNNGDYESNHSHALRSTGTSGGYHHEEYQHNPLHGGRMTGVRRHESEDFRKWDGEEDEEERKGGRDEKSSLAGSRKYSQPHPHDYVGFVSEKIFERFLTFCGLIMAACLGSYLRIGMMYFKIWKTESNYSIMYSQIFGCILMGMVTYHRKYYYEQSVSSFHRAMYIAVTSGLCGSITTFDAWSMECNKSFFLQWDTSPGHAYGSYNAGNFLEWLVCLVTGVAVPLVALRFGYMVAEGLAFCDVLMKTTSWQLQTHYAQISAAMAATAQSADFPNVQLPPPLEQYLAEENAIPLKNTIKERILILASLVSMILIVVLPAALYPTWVVFTYTGLFGAIGVCLRHLLTPLNQIRPDFPIGTFIANVAGTWMFAVFTTVSKFSVGYYDVASQSVLFGLTTGFCGCLTSVSTFVVEVDELPMKHSYKYSVLTNLAAQLGILLMFNVAAFKSIPEHTIVSSPINMCAASMDLCGTFLVNIGCSIDLQINVPCDDMHNGDYDTYQGLCSCGTFSTNHISEMIIDSQVKSNTSSVVPMWPRKPRQSTTPTEAIDFCLTFENMCDGFFNHIGCPADQRTLNGCDRKGLLFDEAVCRCGSVDIPGRRIQEIIVERMLTQRYDLVPFQGYATMTNIDFCFAFEYACNRILDHVHAPHTQRRIVGCTKANNYSSWVGACTAGQFDASTPVAEVLFNALVSPNVNSLLVPFVSNPLATFAPTVKPTAVPTASPSTKAPLNIPTMKPVNAPTARPSLKPTLPPSRSPTLNPTPGPTDAASPFPTTLPYRYTIHLSPYPSISPLYAPEPTQSPNALQPARPPPPPHLPRSWDMCASFFNVCNFFMDKIACPSSLRTIKSCGGVVPQWPRGQMQYWVGQCSCGSLRSVSSRASEIIVDAMTEQQLMVDYWLIPGAHSPFELVLTSNPYRQLLQPRYPVPN